MRENERRTHMSHHERRLSRNTLRWGLLIVSTITQKKASRSKPPSILVKVSCVDKANRSYVFGKASIESVNWWEWERSGLTCIAAYAIIWAEILLIPASFAFPDFVDPFLPSRLIDDGPRNKTLRTWRTISPVMPTITNTSTDLDKCFVSEETLQKIVCICL